MYEKITFQLIELLLAVLFITNLVLILITESVLITSIMRNGSLCLFLLQKKLRYKLIIIFTREGWPIICQC